MIDTSQASLLRAIEELRAVFPEMRFGQLIANLSTLAKGLSAESLWGCRG